MTATMKKTIENYERRVLGIPPNVPFSLVAHNNNEQNKLCIHLGIISLEGKWDRPTVNVTEEIRQQVFDLGGYYLSPDKAE